MKTAEEDAWEENFFEDIVKIADEILVLLNKQMSIDTQFNIDLYKNYVVIENRNLKFYLEKGYAQNSKIKWAIYLGIGSHLSGKGTMVLVSHRDVYTKQELERAKNSIIVKILDHLKKQ